MAASTLLSPSARFLLARSSALSSRTRSFIAARSPSVNTPEVRPVVVVRFVMVRFADFFLLLVAVFFSAIGSHLLDAGQGTDGIGEGTVAEMLLRSGSAGHARHRNVAGGRLGRAAADLSFDGDGHPPRRRAVGVLR